MNVTIDLNKLYYQDLTFSNAINQYCESWKNYSTYAHDFYIVLFWIIAILGILSLFIKKEYKLYYKATGGFWDHPFIERYKLNVFEWKINILWFRDLAISVLLVRIFQVYYIIKWYL